MSTREATPLGQRRLTSKDRMQRRRTEDKREVSGCRYLLQSTYSEEAQPSDRPAVRRNVRLLVEAPIEGDGRQGLRPDHPGIRRSNFSDQQY